MSGVYDATLGEGVYDTTLGEGVYDTTMGRSRYTTQLKSARSLSKELMDNAPFKSGIPSLREPGHQWVHDGQAKADLLARAFSSK